MGTTTVRRLDPHRDRAAVARLWAAALDPSWPVLPDALDLLGAGYVVQVDRSVVGVVAHDPRGSILLLAVDPAHQRRGHGTRLLDHALADLRAAGARSARLGAGGDRYIWPGLPTSCGDAVGEFFARRGWVEDDVAVDLVQDLQADGVADRMAAYAPPAGIEVGLAGPRLMADVVAFEDTHFPQWSRYFREPHDGVLIARDGTGAIVGSLLLDGPGRSATPYWPILGDDPGAIACVGVRPDHEGRGVGTAMVAAATTLLAERGVRNCVIDWVVRVAFYGRLGYRPHRTYSMRTRGL
ncbi:MAG TPA: GNAT family N-acetyltransferase [Acidimicrobiales bacterium]